MRIGLGFQIGTRRTWLSGLGPIGVTLAGWGRMFGRSWGKK